MPRMQKYASIQVLEAVARCEDCDFIGTDDRYVRIDAMTHADETGHMAVFEERTVTRFNRRAGGGTVDADASKASG